MADAAVVNVPVTPAKTLEAPAAAEQGEKSWEVIRDEAVKADATEPSKAKDKQKTEPGKDEPAKDRKVKFTEWETYNKKNAELTRREREFEAKYTKGSTELQAVEKRTKELDDRAKTLDKLETDPKAFVEHFAKRLNMSPGKVVNALNDFFLEQKSPAELEIAKFREDQKARDEKQATEKTEAAKAAKTAERDREVVGYKVQIADYVTKNGERYTYITGYAPQEVAAAAWNLIEAHHKKTGNNISLDKALAQLESEEEAQYQRYQKILEKRQPGGAQQVPVNTEPGGARGATSAEPQRPTTLNPRQAGQRSPQQRGQSDQDDWEESKRQAGVSR